MSVSSKFHYCNKKWVCKSVTLSFSKLSRVLERTLTTLIDSIEKTVAADFHLTNTYISFLKVLTKKRNLIKLHSFFKDYYLANRQEMTEDEVCQYFGKKWKRHRSRLKKCLLVAIEDHDRENGSSENMEMEFDEAAPPPGKYVIKSDCWSVSLFHGLT